MSSAAGFSYAQAAQGRAPAPTSSKTSSGTGTPAGDVTSNSNDGENSDLTIAADETSKAKSSISGESKPVVSSASSVTSPDAAASSISAKDDDGSSVQNASSESTWDSKSQSSEPIAKATETKKSKSKGEQDNSEEPAKERKAAKPKLTEAPPPAVNIWTQRAQALQSKPSAPAASTVRAPESTKKEQKSSDTRKRTGPTATHGQDQPQTQTQGHEGRSGNARGERNNAGRQGLDDAQKKASAGRSAPAANAPAPSNEVAWPSMETAREEERRRAQEKEEKADKEQAQIPAAKPVSKRDWNTLPITPNVIFETSLPTRGAPRGGRGGARGASHASGRAGHSGDRASARAQSLPNAESSVSKDQAEKADREAMPPPAKPARGSSESHWRDAAPFEPRAQEGVVTNGDVSLANGTSHDSGAEIAVNGSTVSGRQSSTKRGKHDSYKQSSDPLARRASVASRAGADGEAIESQNAKLSSTERRSESRPFDSSANPPTYREGKSKRGRGGHRGGLGNGHYNHASQNFPAEFFASAYAAPYQPQRGAHYSQNSRNGYRGANMRSQSIPIDDLGRAQTAYPAYPVQMMPGYAPMPDYYGNYAPVPYQPLIEQMYLLPQISQQIEYYFSVDNLIKDMFFRKHMDSQGYVFLSFVADFKRLKNLTTDYDLIKYVCLQSTNIELRTGDDGRDRLRKVGDHERWVLPMSERDPSAQNDGPARVERPAPPQLSILEQGPYTRGPHSAGPYERRFTEAPYHMNGMTPAFYPDGMEPGYSEHAGSEESRGRQVKSPGREHDASPFVVGADADGEADTFPNEALVTLTVVVRKSASPRPPYHNSNSRTFSDGSIDSKSIFEDSDKPKTNGAALTNGGSPTSAPKASTPAQTTATGTPVDDASVQLFWVKDREAPVDSLPADAGHEMYTHLHEKALSQRKVAATGTCPYDMDVLYQFWSHFLIRNFNAQMYAEFRGLAEQDAKSRHNNVGMANLLKYYNEATASQIPVRDRVARDYVSYVQGENASGERPALKQLRSAWRNGATNLKNRKKLSDIIDVSPDAASLKVELES